MDPEYIVVAHPDKLALIVAALASMGDVRVVASDNFVMEDVLRADDLAAKDEPRPKRREQHPRHWMSGKDKKRNFKRHG